MGGQDERRKRLVRGTTGKQAVFGMSERGGSVRIIPIGQQALCGKRFKYRVLEA